MTKNRESWQVRAIRAAQDVIASQPSEEEQKAALAAIDSLIRSLQQIRTALSSLTSTEELRSVERATQVLEAFYQSARRKPTLAAALGISAQIKKKSPRGHSLDPEAFFSELESLSTDEIQARLLDPQRYSRSALESLSRYLRIRTARGITRDDMVDRIVKLGFANRRGYKALGGSDPRSG